jgi:hypothetical protein
LARSVHPLLLQEPPEAYGLRGQATLISRGARRSSGSRCLPLTR